ncbi:MAG: secretin N-terminal domain-containing protein, partial [Pseudomonadota bacterium]
MIEQASLQKVAPRPQAQIFRGRTPSTRGRSETLGGDSLVLNFDNASIAEAASLILGDFLGIPYDIHPGVNGVVNLRSADALAGDAALGAFETVLRQNNAALVQDNGLYRIVPASLALGYAAAPQIGAGRPLKPGYAVQITPLKFVSATDMAAIIKPLAGDDAVIRIDTDRNLLLLAGSSGELALWLETIRTFDIDWFAGKSVGIFPVRHVAAAQVVKELQAIFDAPESDQDAAVRFLAIDRTNAVMAITRAAALLDKVRAWAQRLDQDSGAARRLRVYSMKNAKASDVAPLLQDIFDAPSDNAGARSIVAPGEAPSSAPNPGVVAVSTASAPQQANARRRAAGGNGLRIIPDESANTLLMMATQEEFDRITQALRQLDVAPLQVLVEATILEVTITNDLRYGVQYFLEGSIAQESAVATLSSAASSAILPTFPGASLVLGEPTQIVLDALEGITDLN